MVQKKTDNIKTRGTGFADYKNVLDTNVTVNIRNLGSDDIAHEPVPYDYKTIIKEITFDDDATITNKKAYQFLVKPSDWQINNDDSFVLTGVSVRFAAHTAIGADNQLLITCWDDITKTITDDVINSGNSIVFSTSVNVSDFFFQTSITPSNLITDEGDHNFYLKREDFSQKQFILSTQSFILEIFNNLGRNLAPNFGISDEIEVILIGFTV